MKGSKVLLPRQKIWSIEKLLYYRLTPVHRQLGTRRVYPPVRYAYSVQLPQLPLLWARPSLNNFPINPTKAPTTS